MSGRYFGLDARLTSGPSDLLATAAFGHELEGIGNLFADMDLADIAHVRCLLAAELIPHESGQALLDGLGRMHDAGPASIEWDPALGDIYNNRTVRLTELIGDHSKALHTGRARRESTTVAWHLATRRLVAMLGLEVCSLVDTLAGVARAHTSTVMSDYTYLQRAHPTTLAHYLLTFAQPLLRDTERLGGTHDRLNRSPAESGSVNGSRLPFDREYAAAMLGFDEPMAHTRDAMWAPDLATEAIEAAMSVAVTLDRLAEELIVFSTEEFGIVELADRHCRTSVIMPQKKNPYGLAYLRGFARRLAGKVSGVIAAQLMPTGQPDSRTVAYLDVIDGLADAVQATALLREIVDEATFDVDRMRLLAESGHSYATDLCEVLLLEHGLSNRASHELVGRAIRSAVERGVDRITSADLETAATALDMVAPAIDDERIAEIADVELMIASRSTIGGAGPQPLTQLLADTTRTCAQRSDDFAARLARARAAEDAVLAGPEGSTT